MPRPVGVDVNSLRALRHARDRIDRDYAEPLEMAVLAADAGYSLGQFIRAFDAAYGETPGLYRTRRRVERACELARRGGEAKREVIAAARDRSTGMYGMSDYRSSGSSVPAQLVLGFGNLSERSIAAGIAAVGDVLRSSGKGH